MIPGVAAALGMAGALWAQAAAADIQHIVIFRYQPQVEASTKADIARRFLALKDTARRDGRPYIASIVGGQAIREGFDQQMEQAFVVTFRNTADRDYWVGMPYSDTMDPDHQALAAIVEPLLARDADGGLTGLFVFEFDDVAPR